MKKPIYLLLTLLISFVFSCSNDDSSSDDNPNNPTGERIFQFKLDTHLEYYITLRLSTYEGIGTEEILVYEGSDLREIVIPDSIGTIHIMETNVPNMYEPIPTMGRIIIGGEIYDEEVNTHWNNNNTWTYIESIPEEL